MCRRSRILTVPIDFEKHAGRPASRLRIGRIEKLANVLGDRANDLRLSHCQERQLRPRRAPVYTPSTAHDLDKLSRSASFEFRVIRAAPSCRENDTRHQDGPEGPAGSIDGDDAHGSWPPRTLCGVPGGDSNPPAVSGQRAMKPVLPCDLGPRSLPSSARTLSPRPPAGSPPRRQRQNASRCQAAP